MDFVGLDVKFDDIGYCVKGSGKQILTGISGTAQKGSLLGIMGPSGSGKCKLLSKSLMADAISKLLIATLVGILSGKLHATSGSIHLQGVKMSLSG